VISSRVLTPKQIAMFMNDFPVVDVVSVRMAVHDLSSRVIKDSGRFTPEKSFIF
jgi:hypothetical protein